MHIQPSPRPSRPKTLAIAFAGAAALLLLLVPGAVANAVYVVNSRSDNVSVIDSRTNRPVGSPIPVGQSPRSIAITPDGRTAYVPNEGSSSVSVIDTQTSQLVGSPIRVGFDPEAIAIAPDGRTAYVVNSFSENVSMIDTATNHLVGSPIPVGMAPSGIAIAPDGQLAYVTNFSSDTVSVIKLQTNEVIATIGVGLRPTDVEVTPDGRTVYVTNRVSQDIWAIDTATNTVIAKIPIGVGAERIAITPNGKTAYVTGATAILTEIALIDLETNALAGTIAGGAPLGIAITPDGKTAYVTTVAAEKSVSAIDTQTNQRIGNPIPVGEGPRAIAIDPLNLAPIAVFSTLPRVRLGAPSAFDASASSDVDGSIASFAWSFGDGTKKLTTGPTLRHAFTKPGTYGITLTVTDPEGCSTAQVLNGSTVSCNGSPLASRTGTVKVVYPSVRVRCPRSAKTMGCKISLQGVTKRRKGVIETGLAKVRLKAGKSTITSLRPKRRFIKKLGTARIVLVKETLQIGSSSRTTFRRLLIRPAGKA
jgi:YVTN family beta-propeller protein